MDTVQSKTICSAFDEQLDISEALYKMYLKCWNYLNGTTANFSDGMLSKENRECHKMTKYGCRFVAFPVLRIDKI